MNVFKTHASIIEDYSSFIHSFISIADPEISRVVDRALTSGTLWPEPLLQFNPSFEMFGGLDELIKSKTLHGAIGEIFKGYKLYRHQVEAIRLGTTGKDFIVTSGTGSGKSLTYIGSIFHHLLSNPAAKGVTAVVVYPMNALINSQFEEFTRYKKNYEDATGNEFPIIFGQYTGQEGEDARAKMRENPPHILLTNYMMLELLLTRVRERNTNLEQCALLAIEYEDLDENIAEDKFWAVSPLFGVLDHADRKELVTTILDFFRLEFAIHSENFLTQSRIQESERQFRESLKQPWTLDSNEKLHEPYYIRYQKLSKTAKLYTKSMGPASSLGKFI